jgi:hypothetical protein
MVLIMPEFYNGPRGTPVRPGLRQFDHAFMQLTGNWFIVTNLGISMQRHLIHPVP